MRTLCDNQLSYAEFDRLFPAGKPNPLLPFNVPDIQRLLHVALDGFNVAGNRKILIDAVREHMHRNGAVAEFVSNLRNDIASGSGASSGAAGVDTTGGELDLKALTKAAAVKAASAVKTQISSVAAAPVAESSSDAVDGASVVAQLYSSTVDAFVKANTNKILFPDGHANGQTDFSRLLPEADSIIANEGKYNLQGVTADNRLAITVSNTLPGVAGTPGLIKLNAYSVSFWKGDHSATIVQVEGTLSGDKPAIVAEKTTLDQINEPASALALHRVYTFSRPNLSGKQGSSTAYAIRLTREMIPLVLNVNIERSHVLSDERLTAIVGSSPSVLLGKDADRHIGVETAPNNGNGTNLCLAMTVSDALRALYPSLVHRVSRDALAQQVLGALQEFARDTGRLLAQIMSVRSAIVRTDSSFSLSDTSAFRIAAELLRRATLAGATSAQLADKRAAVERDLKALIPDDSHRVAVLDGDALLLQPDTVKFFENICSAISEPPPGGQPMAIKTDLAAAVRAVRELHTRYDAGNAVGRQGAMHMAELFQLCGLFRGLLLSTSRSFAELSPLCLADSGDDEADALPTAIWRFYPGHYELVLQWNTNLVRAATQLEQNLHAMTASYWACLESNSATATLPPAAVTGAAATTKAASDAAAAKASADASAAASKAAAEAETAKAAAATGDATAAAKASSEAAAAAKVASEAAVAAKAAAAKSGGAQGSETTSTTKKKARFTGGTTASALPKLDLSNFRGLSSQDRGLASHAARVGTNHAHIYAVLESQGGRNQWCIFGDCCNSDHCGRNHATPRTTRQQLWQRMQQQQQQQQQCHQTKQPQQQRQQQTQQQQTQQQTQQQQTQPSFLQAYAQGFAAAAAGHAVPVSSPPTPPAPPPPPAPAVVPTTPANDGGLAQLLLTALAKAVHSAPTGATSQQELDKMATMRFLMSAIGR